MQYYVCLRRIVVSLHIFLDTKTIIDTLVIVGSPITSDHHTSAPFLMDCLNITIYDKVIILILFPPYQTPCITTLKKKSQWFNAYIKVDIKHKLKYENLACGTLWVIQIQVFTWGKMKI